MAVPISSAKMFNWTGSVRRRTELSRMIESHEQARHSGIYLLIKKMPRRAAYIAAEDIARWTACSVEDWWTQIATAAENRLNPAHSLSGSGW